MSKGTKNLSKNNRKLALRNESTSLHYRMYKAGKFWLYAGIATFSLGAGIAFSNVAAHADTTPTTTQTAAASSSATLTSTGPATSQVTPTVENTEAQPVNAPSGTTDQTDTSKALISTNLFGNGNTAQAENSTTAQLGDTTKAGALIDTANNTQVRGGDMKGYSTVYGGARTAPDNGSANSGVAVKNDKLDMSFESVNSAAKEKTTTEDQLNDQNAVSSNADDVQTRYGIIYTNGTTSGIDLSTIGDTTNGASVGVQLTSLTQ
ncbi:KxYKxGKxW signal peptide domain-containing protein [Paucilactobacillus sp. N302-9]